MLGIESVLIEFLLAFMHAQKVHDNGYVSEEAIEAERFFYFILTQNS